MDLGENGSRKSKGDPHPPRLGHGWFSETQPDFWSQATAWPQAETQACVLKLIEAETQVAFGVQAQTQVVFGKSRRDPDCVWCFKVKHRIFFFKIKVIEAHPKTQNILWGQGRNLGSLFQTKSRSR